MLGVAGALLAVDIAIVIGRALQGPTLVLFILSLPALLLILPGFFSLQPNEARVLLLFGRYKGTVRESGLHWGNPFYSNGPASPSTSLAEAAKARKAEPAARRVPSRNKISLRART